MRENKLQLFNEAGVVDDLEVIVQVVTFFFIILFLFI
jgi:hypothetical protein